MEYDSIASLNTALDETGPALGPLLMALALYRGATMRAGYGLLTIFRIACRHHGDLRRGNLSAARLSWRVRAGAVRIGLWGIGYAVRDTLLKAIVAGVMPEARRNFAFGLFYTGYGVGWIIGSVTTGLLYSHSIPAVIAFSTAVQMISIPIFLAARRKE